MARDNRAAANHHDGSLDSLLQEATTWHQLAPLLRSLVERSPRKRGRIVEILANRAGSEMSRSTFYRVLDGTSVPKNGDLRALLELLEEGSSWFLWEDALRRIQHHHGRANKSDRQRPSKSSVDGQYRVFVGKDDRHIRISSTTSGEEFVLSMPPGLTVDNLRDALNESVHQTNEEYWQLEVQRAAQLSAVKVEEAPPALQFARRFFEQVVRPESLKPALSADDFMSEKHMERVRRGESFPTRGYMLDALRLSSRLSREEKSYWEWEWYKMQSGLERSQLISLPQFCAANRIKMSEALARASTNSIFYIDGEIWLREGSATLTLLRSTYRA